MNCPVCKTQSLTPNVLESNIVSQKCGTCSGQWVNSFEFWKWLDVHRTNPKPDAPEAPALTSAETDAVKICPECGHFLARYKVGHSLGFSLDRCGNCGGTWFDGNEWELLQGSNLRDQIHLIFSAAWQHRVRNEEHTRHLIELFEEKVGQKDFAEIKRIKEWLAQHPYRRELWSYLADEES
jgi:Zn-finger nucleic acid-binding protein